MKLPDAVKKAVGIRRDRDETPNDLVVRVDKVERRLTYLETQVKLLERGPS